MELGTGMEEAGEAPGRPEGDEESGAFGDSLGRDPNQEVMGDQIEEVDIVDCAKLGALRAALAVEGAAELRGR